jgi:hypothetical protein
VPSTPREDPTHHQRGSASLGRSFSPPHAVVDLSPYFHGTDTSAIQ